MKPVESYEVKILSIGFYSTKSSVIWRGPMASKALNQMILMQIGGIRLYVSRFARYRHSPFYCTILAYHGCCCSVSTPQAVALADAKSFDVYV
jgi:ATP-binding protein involved in chromosome partitioning